MMPREDLRAFLRASLASVVDLAIEQEHITMNRGRGELIDRLTDQALATIDALLAHDPGATP